MLAKLAPWQKAALDAAAYIQKHGLCKGRAENYRTGEVCTVAAISKVLGDLRWRELSATVSLIEDALGLPEEPDAFHLRPLAAWSDAPERTADDVVAALKQAALT